ncbi:hypothetical protein Tco_0862069 [Tanacetum coccineum]
MEECHKLLTDQVDDTILRYNVSKPLPLGGEPGHVTGRAVRTHMRILSVVRIEVFSMYGYNYMKKIVLRRADLKDITHAERASNKIMYPSDFEDRKLPTGNESYHDTAKTSTNLDGEAMMIMRFNEIHKFSDGTLQQIDEEKKNIGYRVRNSDQRTNPAMTPVFGKERCTCSIDPAERRRSTRDNPHSQCLIVLSSGPHGSGGNPTRLGTNEKPIRPHRFIANSFYYKIKIRWNETPLQDSPFDLEAFSDSDYASVSLDRKSTTGGLWIQNQMLDYGVNFMNIKIYIDNESTICIVKNPVFHSKTKHIEIMHHFIRYYYEKKMIQVIKIHTDHNVTDLPIKAFDVSRFNFLIAGIGLLNH